MGADLFPLTGGFVCVTLSVMDALVTFRCRSDHWQKIQAMAALQQRTGAAELRFIIERHVDGVASQQISRLSGERVASGLGAELVEVLRS